MPGALGQNEPIFHVCEAWANIITELLLREEFQSRENNMDILYYIFSLHFVSPPTSPRASGTPQSPDNAKPSGPTERIPVPDGSNEVQIVIDLPNTPQFSFYGDLMEDPEKDPKLEEHQLDHDDENAEIGTSENSFNSGGESRDEFALDNDPSRDHYIDLY